MTHTTTTITIIATTTTEITTIKIIASLLVGSPSEYSVVGFPVFSSLIGPFVEGGVTTSQIGF